MISPASAVASAAALLLQLGCLAVVAARVAGRVEPNDALARCTVAIVVAWAQVVALLELLGLVHAIHEAFVLVAQILLAALVVTRVKARVPGAWRPSLWLVPAAAALALVLVIDLGPASTDPDTIRYHLPNAAWWLRTGSLLQLPFAEPGDPSALNPGNGELVGLWLMLPTHNDTFAHLGNALFGLGSCAAAGLVARFLGASAGRGVVLGVGVLLTPLAWTFGVHSLTVDQPATFGVVAGAAFLLLARESSRPRALLCLAGLALGLAAGSKYVTLAPVALTIVVLAPWRQPLRIALVAGSALLAGGFWFVRNALITGSPLAPEGLVIGGHTVLPAIPTNYGRLAGSLFEAVRSGHPGVLAIWIRLAILTLGPAVLLPVLAVAGLLVGRRTATQDGRLALLLTLLCVAFFATPFTSGGMPTSSIALTATLRYALPLLVLAAGCAGARLPRRILVPLAAVLLLADLRSPWLALRGDAVPSVVALACAAAAGGVCLLAVRSHRRRQPRPLLASWPRLGVLVVSLAGVTLLTLGLQPRNSTGDLVHATAAKVAPGRAVVVINVFQLRPFLGPELDLPITSLGTGPEGASPPWPSGAVLDRAVDAFRPCVVLVSGAGTPDARPAGWSPPASWERRGQENEATVYAVR